jgi:hypothetical protein
VWESPQRQRPHGAKRNKSDTVAIPGTLYYIKIKPNE